jgi:hypothetical protein
MFSTPNRRPKKSWRKASDCSLPVTLAEVVRIWSCGESPHRPMRRRRRRRM